MAHGSLADPRTIARRARQAIGVAATVALGQTVGVASTSCGRCVTEVRARVALAGELTDPTPIRDLETCLARGCPTLDRLTLLSCEKIEGDLACTYDSGYRDPADDFTEADDDACAEVCDVGNERFLGCVAISGGHHACLSRGGCVGGRRFADMPPFDGPSPSLATFLGELAHLEACSVTAFELLASDLARHGAPSPLIRRCLAAARDEARHHRAVLALARAHGFEGESVIPGSAPHRAIPSLLAIAKENVAEGCVRETWGATCMEWLAELWPERAGLWRRVARDEARHAALAFAIDAWIDRALSSDERVDVAQARRRALEELRRSPVDPLLASCGAAEVSQHAARHAMIASLVDAPSAQRRAA